MKKIFSIIFYIALVFSLSENNLFAQIKLITSVPGVPAQNFIYNSFSFGVGRGLSLLDFTGDNKPELTLMEDEGIFYYLKIIDGADPNNSWKIPLPNGIIAVLIGFIDAGSYKPDEGTTFNFKEIVVAEKKGNKFINPIIIRSDDNYQTIEYDSFGANSVVVAAGDINGDGKAEIAVFNPDAIEIQIWGYE